MTATDPHPSLTAYAHPEAIVTAQWLGAQLGKPNIKVIESDEDTLLYDIGHIPSAMRIDWRRDLSHPLIRDIVSPEAFTQLMRTKGIRRDDTVIIYGDHSNWWAAYTFWVFTLYGHPDVRILNGGRDAWMAEERDTSYAVPEPQPSDYPDVSILDDNHRIFVAELLANREDTQIFDVRSPVEFSGVADADHSTPNIHVQSQRPGHIPGAHNLEWNATVHANGNFNSRAELEEIFADFDPKAQTVTYCLLGERSAHTWFVLTYLLGWDSVRSYDGSWSEWGNMVRMPIECGEK